MAARVRKAVFPVAGLGTRFLPATKAMPKEMLTVVDRPLIQHVVDEAMEAGIEHFIFVTGRNKSVIEDHFDRQFELEQVLAERGKTAELARSERRSARAGKHQLHPAAGAARARSRGVVRARAGRQRAVRSAAARRAGANPRQGLSRPDARRLRASAAATSSRSSRCPTTRSRITAWSASARATAESFPVDGMVEKPAPGTEPSNLTILGRYILQPEIFDLLSAQEKGAGGEIQLTDAMLAAAQAAALLRAEI